MSTRQIKKLEKIATLAAEILNEVRKGGPRPDASLSKRTRRSGKDLASFRKMLKAERKKGIPAAQLARQHGVSPAYIYQLK